jgi:hypothetical protein
MNLRETGWEDVEWVELAQDRSQWGAVLNAVMNLRVLAPRSSFIIVGLGFQY